MIRCRKPRQEKELLSCFNDLVNKIEAYTRLQDAIDRKSDAELVALRDRVAQLEAQLAPESSV